MNSGTTATIDIDKVVQVLKGAQAGLKMAYPNYGLPTKKPEVETRRGVLHAPAPPPTTLL